jgi:hypothetical protein
MDVATFRSLGKRKQAPDNAEYTLDQEQGIGGMQGKEPSRSH